MIFWCSQFICIDHESILAHFQAKIGQFLRVKDFGTGYLQRLQDVLPRPGAVHPKVPPGRGLYLHAGDVEERQGLHVDDAHGVVGDLLLHGVALGDLGEPGECSEVPFQILICGLAF